jgi:hypothetical protein
MNMPRFTADVTLDRTNHNQYLNTCVFTARQETVVPQIFACLGQALRGYGQCVGHGYNEACAILLHLEARSCFL